MIPFHLPIEQGGNDPNYSSIEIKEAVRSLEKDLRIVIHLYYFCDWPVKDIASAIELPEGTIKSKLYRARELLREKLQHHGWRGADHS